MLARYTSLSHATAKKLAVRTPRPLADSHTKGNDPKPADVIRYVVSGTIAYYWLTTATSVSGNPLTSTVARNSSNQRPVTRTGKFRHCLVMTDVYPYFVCNASLVVPNRTRGNRTDGVGRGE